MKINNSFITNSSSCSFLIMTTITDPKRLREVLIEAINAVGESFWPEDEEGFVTITEENYEKYLGKFIDNMVDDLLNSKPINNVFSAFGEGNSEEIYSYLDLLYTFGGIYPKLKDNEEFVIHSC